MQKRCCIGYALPAKKVSTLIQPSLVAHAEHHGIDLVSVDPTEPLVSQGPFDAVVHKLYDADWNSQLQLFSAKNPGVPIIDPPESIARIHNRVTMLEVVSRLKISGAGSEVVEAPKQVVVSDSAELEKKGDELGSQFGFPLLAKPLEANGSEKSHKMFLVFDREGLDRVDSPVILQEFVNHGGVLFKVYVAGNYVQCVKRKSLPNIPEELMGKVYKGAVPFSQISNLPVQEEDGFEGVEMPASGFVEEVAKGIREQLEVNLFNFDMIRDARDEKRYLVIDINYFPGYAKMPNYETVLTDFFLDVVGKKKGGGEITVNGKEKP